MMKISMKVKHIVLEILCLWRILYFFPQTETSHPSQGSSFLGQTLVKSLVFQHAECFC